MGDVKLLLLVGNWNWDIYEESIARGFCAAGWEVLPFKTLAYLPQGRVAQQLRRLRTRWTCSRLNLELLSTVEAKHPDMILLVRCDEILPETLAAIRILSPGSFIVAYHNDNPFRGDLRRFTMRQFLAGLSVVDLVLVYRPGDIPSARKNGARWVEVFPPSYIRARHLPTSGGEPNEVIYIGHFEKDGREHVLQALYDAGVYVRIYGMGWEAAQRRNIWLAQQDIRLIWGGEYAALLSSAKIALVFLSGRNHDVYTRRCFEIPGCGSMMMAPRTPELERYFEDGKEAVYWDSTSELVAKVKYYLQHDEDRTAIARAGRIRLLKDGHDEFARACQLISLYEGRVQQKY